MNIDLLAVYGIGIMTLATPCVLPLLPVYLGMLLGESLEAARGGRGRLRLFTATLAFTAGFALVFTLLGLGASVVGGFLQEHRNALMIVGGLLIILFGLKFLGLLKVPWLDREMRLPEMKVGRRLVDATLFGVVFALGWTPCVGPILGSVLTYTASRAADPLTGALYLAIYSFGVATPLLVISLFADRLVPMLSKLNQKLPVFEKVTGGLLILLGVSLVAATVIRSGYFISEEPAVASVVGGEEAAAILPPLGQPSERPRVVEFFREGCSACEEARASVEALREDCSGRRVEILTVDAEEPGNRALARQFAVAVVPTFVLLDHRGEERGRFVGAPELGELRGAAASLMEETCVGVAPDEADWEQEQEEEGGGCATDGGATGDDLDNEYLEPEQSCQS